MLAKQDFIDCDLNSRATQWSYLLEGPPGLARRLIAYRFAGLALMNGWSTTISFVCFSERSGSLLLESAIAGTATHVSRLIERNPRLTRS